MRLAALAEQSGPDRPQVAVVCGQPGLGKTAFAVHAAHALVPLFPDGRFYLDLRGMDQQPTPPRDALARLLRALGATDVPAGTDERSGLLRSLLRDRRVLLLLDNAADENQVRPLLPGEGASLTLVTSRHALAGLEAVHRTELALLRREEAIELLTRIVGPHRVTQEAQARATSPNSAATSPWPSASPDNASPPAPPSASANSPPSLPNRAVASTP
ncbi:NB-ARC domain-containing protein [Streptomyces sp. NPDC053429]|uniref:NB-ARC domain-containing protein n=1 Tax=Streptomyces sp. NPDC053429 TaxID=3365702 RepID=UPI0037D72449